MGAGRSVKAVLKTLTEDELTVGSRAVAETLLSSPRCVVPASEAPQRWYNGVTLRVGMSAALSVRCVWRTACFQALPRRSRCTYRSPVAKFAQTTSWPRVLLQESTYIFRRCVDGCGLGGKRGGRRKWLRVVLSSIECILAKQRVGVRAPSVKLLYGWLFAARRTLQVYGATRHDMDMERVGSMAEVLALPANKWGIRESSTPYAPALPSVPAGTSQLRGNGSLLQPPHGGEGACFEFQPLVRLIGWMQGCMDAGSC